MMSSNFSELKTVQSEWAEKITNYGKENQYSPEVTSAVITLAHQESDLGRYRHNLKGSSASGLFQFMGPHHISDELAGYREHHPDGRYAHWSARQVFQSDEATMVVMFDKVERWRQEFNEGRMPDKIDHKLQSKPELASLVHEDFNSYVFLRHNTSITQTEARLYAENGILASNHEITAFVEEAYHARGIYPDYPSDNLKAFKQQIAAIGEAEALSQHNKHEAEPQIQLAQNTYGTASDVVAASAFQGSEEQKAALTRLVEENLRTYRQTQMLSPDREQPKTVDHYQEADNQFRM
jgi:hypothetical protein